MSTRPAIWYCEQCGEEGYARWWMERADATTNRDLLVKHIGAIYVTNAYKVLPPETIARLAADAGYSGSKGGWLPTSKSWQG